jgi:hypothetical protein
VQGKGYGRTNIMALNRQCDGVHTHVTVTGNDGGTTLNRGPAHHLELCGRPP